MELLVTRERCMVAPDILRLKETADWLKAAMPKLKLWTGAKVELVAEADMPKPQVYIGNYPKTEKYSNEDIHQVTGGY
ncbi:hypothetical protein ACLKA6_009914 [Drosophila palustris]